jgi:hypothetical protein
LNTLIIFSVFDFSMDMSLFYSDEVVVQVVVEVVATVKTTPY